MKLFINNNLLANKPLFLHSRRIPPTKSYFQIHEDGINVNVTQKSRIRISFRKDSMQLLSPPYTTSCFDYATIGFKSHLDCISRCKGNYTVTHFGGWHPAVIADQNVDVPFSYNKSITNNFAFDKKMSTFCLNFCGDFPDCHSEYYKVDVIGFVQNSLGFDIVLLSPHGLNTLYTHSPKLRLVEFLCFAGSQLSPWFGFSFIASSYSLFHAIDYVYKKVNLTQTILELI